MLPPEILERLKSVIRCPDLMIFLSPDWGADSESYREKIRHSIAEEGFEKFSISHCPIVGGYASTRKPMSLGFDVEITERVRSRTILQVSMQEELRRAPQPSLLWTAKEAAFKSLSGSYGSTLLSQIEIKNWQLEEIKSQLWSYRCNVSGLPVNDGIGCAFQYMQNSFSIFGFSTQPWSGSADR